MLLACSTGPSPSLESEASAVAAGSKVPYNYRPTAGQIVAPYCIAASRDITAPSVTKNTAKEFEFTCAQGELRFYTVCSGEHIVEGIGQAAGHCYLVMKDIVEKNNIDNFFFAHGLSTREATNPAQRLPLIAIAKEGRLPKMRMPEQFTTMYGLLEQSDANNFTTPEVDLGYMKLDYVYGDPAYPKRLHDYLTSSNGTTVWDTIEIGDLETSLNRDEFAPPRTFGLWSLPDILPEEELKIVGYGYTEREPPGNRRLASLFLWGAYKLPLPSAVKARDFGPADAVYVTLSRPAKNGAGEPRVHDYSSNPCFFDSGASLYVEKRGLVSIVGVHAYDQFVRTDLEGGFEPSSRIFRPYSSDDCRPTLYCSSDGLPDVLMQLAPRLCAHKAWITSTLTELQAGRPGGPKLPTFNCVSGTPSGPTTSPRIYSKTSSDPSVCAAKPRRRRQPYE